MAGAGGFEPPTFRFVAECSIQLSYAPLKMSSQSRALRRERIIPVHLQIVKRLAVQGPRFPIPDSITG